MSKIILFAGIILMLALVAVASIKLNSRGQAPKTDTSDVIVFSPSAGAVVESPLIIDGKARGTWFFEASFPIKILDETGKTIAEGIAQAESDWMTTDYVPFKAELEFAHKANGRGTLVLKRDNPSGLPQNDKQMELPIVFSPVETMSVDVYLGNSVFDPGASDCANVYSVKRFVPKTLAVGSAALEELLKGPTEKEKTAGYFTSINSGVKIKSLGLQDGILRADFDARLEEAVGGSCRVTNIVAQLNKTLGQFSSVKKVIISIDGRTEDILQP